MVKPHDTMEYLNLCPTYFTPESISVSFYDRSKSPLHLTNGHFILSDSKTTRYSQHDNVYGKFHYPRRKCRFPEKTSQISGDKSLF